MLNLYCQPDRIENLPRRVSLSMSEKVHPEKFNWGGKTIPECGQQHLMNWGPGPNKKMMGRELSRAIMLIWLWGQCDRLLHTSTAKPYCDGLRSFNPWAKTNLPFSSCFVGVLPWHWENEQIRSISHALGTQKNRSFHTSSCWNLLKILNSR